MTYSFSVGGQTDKAGLPNIKHTQAHAPAIIQYCEPIPMKDQRNLLLGLLGTIRAGISYASFSVCVYKLGLCDRMRLCH